MVVIIYKYIGYKYKASTWYLTGFPNGSNQVVTLGQQYNAGEKPTVILYTYINHNAAGRPGSSEVPRNPLTRWDVSSIPANGIFLTKKLKTK